MAAMSVLLDALVVFAAAGEGVVHDAAEEGRRIIIAMLIVGLIFAGIVIVGEYVHWYRHERPYRHRY
jgi:hypothetical protein